MGSIRSFSPGTPAWIDFETVVGTTGAGRFYCSLFGWRVLAWHRPIEDSRYGYWIFQQGGADIGGLSPGQQAVWTVYVSVTDVDETTQTVLDSGGTVLTRPFDVYDAGRLAVFADPEGARFAVWQARLHSGVDVMDEPNSFCGFELTCRDRGAAASFYRAVFGWRAERAGFVRLEADGGGRAAGLVSSDATPRWLAQFAVADVDAMAARAVELGGAVKSPPIDLPGSQGRTATLADAEGALFGVRQSR